MDETINVPNLLSWLNKFLAEHPGAAYSYVKIFSDGSVGVCLRYGNEKVIRSLNNINDLNELIVPPVRRYTVHYTDFDMIFCMDFFQAKNPKDAISQCINKHPKLRDITGCDLGLPKQDK